MPVDSEALKCVLLQLDSDTDWDLSDPVQKALHMAAEERFNMSSLKRSYKRTAHEEFVGEKTIASKEKKAKTLDCNASSGSGTKIKIEEPLVTTFKQKLTALKTGKGH